MHTLKWRQLYRRIVLMSYSRTLMTVIKISWKVSSVVSDSEGSSESIHHDSSDMTVMTSHQHIRFEGEAVVHVGAGGGEAMVHVGASREI